MKEIKMMVLFIALSSTTFAAEIIKITPATRHLVPKGKSLDAIDGDWIMKNDLVVAVIGQAMPGREANMRVQSVQGAVIDFTSLADNNDYLAAFYPQGYPQADSRRNPAEFAHVIKVVKGNGAAIVLQASRQPVASNQYESVTEYELRDGEAFLRVKTTYRNVGSSDVILPVSDKLRMDMDILDATPTGKHHLAFIYNKWFQAAYGLYSPEGLNLPEKPVIGSEPGTGLLVAYRNNGKGRGDSALLKPNERIEIVRYLMYDKDAAGIQRASLQFARSGVVLTSVRVADENKKPITGAFVDVLDAAGSIASFAITDASGAAGIPLPTGTYALKASKIGHDTVSLKLAVNSAPAALSITMKPLTSISFDVKEAGTGKYLPVKLEFRGINGTPDPFLGSTKRAEGADNFYYAINKGPFDVSLAPGNYLVTVSRGPEYETLGHEVSIRSGQHQRISAEIKRSFSSPGWVIADFHNHSTISGDNDTETRGRLINIAGAGIEFAPATEHNRISSYTDDLKRFGLSDYVASAAGIELTGPTGVAGGPNHQNSILLKVQDGKQGGGFPGISADVYTQLKGIYDYDNGKAKFIQHNHPGMGIPMLYFDKNQDEVIDEGFNTRRFTDAIEIQTFISNILEVTAEGAKNKNTPIFYWLQMLNQGDRIFATTTSDSHSVGEGTGSRFLYVYSPKDTPASLDAEQLVMNAKKGRMVMSNGPFLKAELNGAIPGDDVKRAGEYKMNIEVSANNEIRIDRVQLLINGKQDARYNFTPAANPALFSGSALQFRHSFTLGLDKDAIVIAVATGVKKNPAPNARPNARQQAPMAVANPFFVDTDGNGFQANKDTLGQPLPVSKKRTAANPD